MCVVVCVCAYVCRCVCVCILRVALTLTTTLTRTLTINSDHNHAHNQNIGLVFVVGKVGGLLTDGVKSIGKWFGVIDDSFGDVYNEHAGAGFVQLSRPNPPRTELAAWLFTVEN